MVKVLILCTGNSIRSQIAEGYFNFYANKLGIFFSAGIEKSEINPNAIEVMKEDNIDLSEHLSKSLEAFANVNFNYVLTICDPPNHDYKKDLIFDQWFHFPIPEPTIKSNEDKANLKEFRKVRDEVKVMVLKFIGQELLTNEISNSYA